MQHSDSGEHQPEAVYPNVPASPPVFRPLATWTIMGLNAAVFLLMVVSGVHFFNPLSSDLMTWGAQARFAVTDGEYWRMFTCTFIHIGVFHLAINMYSLFMIGNFLEQMIGRTYYVIFYLMCGLSGSAASIWWNASSVSAGASGAIFGLMGMLLALFSTNIVNKEHRTKMLSSLAQTVVLNLLVGFSSGVIDNAGHIGGLVGGLIAGYSLYLVYYFRNSKNWRIIGPSIGAAGILALCIALVAATPKGENLEKIKLASMQQFSEYERQLLGLINSPQPDSVKIISIRSQGLALTDSMKTVLEETEKYFAGNAEELKRFRQLRRYVGYRRNELELMLKLGDGDTTAVEPFQKNETRIQAVVDSLNKENQ